MSLQFPPLILGLLLGPLMEENLRRSLLLSRGDPSVFFTWPLSLALMIVTGILLLLFLMPLLGRAGTPALANGEE
jgi:putative tricarboxylic transport membrane protein